MTPTVSKHKKTGEKNEKTTQNITQKIQKVVHKICNALKQKKF